MPEEEFEGAEKARPSRARFCQLESFFFQSFLHFSGGRRVAQSAKWGSVVGYRAKGWRISPGNWRPARRAGPTVGCVMERMIPDGRDPGKRPTRTQMLLRPARRHPAGDLGAEKAV